MKSDAKRKRFTASEVQRRLRAMGSARNRAGMARFGITPGKSYGVSAPKLHALAREIGRDHALAQQLWRTGNREARIVGALIGEPQRLTAAQMDRWCRDFDSWDVVDATCMYLYSATPLGWRKAVEWSRREPEFEKRAGFALMACLAWRDKAAGDANFRRLLPHIRRGARDPRNFVRKAVNWALRQIGKRNRALNRAAIACAEHVRRDAARYSGKGRTAALWVAADALRELRSDGVQRRLRGI